MIKIPHTILHLQHKIVWDPLKVVPLAVSFHAIYNSNTFVVLTHLTMTREQRVNLQYYSAIAMLICGVALTIAGFIVPPTGEISDSVLWFAAQTMIYAGSVFGVNVYVNDKFNSIRERLGIQDKEDGKEVKKA